jgi:hypothetical protein
VNVTFGKVMELDLHVEMQTGKGALHTNRRTEAASVELPRLASVLSGELRRRPWLQRPSQALQRPHGKRGNNDPPMFASGVHSNLQ